MDVGFLTEDDCNYHCETTSACSQQRTPELIYPQGEKEEKEYIIKRFAVYNFIKSMSMFDIDAQTSNNISSFKNIKMKMESLRYHLDRMLLNAIEEKLTINEIEEQIAQFKKKSPDDDPITLKFVKTH